MPPLGADRNPSGGTRRRQRPGAACDECRRRKLRCDGLQPQCTVCRETNILCEITERGVRGPKKGHLKVLKNRLLHLEAILETRFSANQPPQQAESLVDSRNRNYADHEVASSGLEHEEFDPTGYESPPVSDQPAPPNNAEGISASAKTPEPLPQLSGILKEELDQLYLDRVHQLVPILHQRRYLSWSKSSTKTASQLCLQYAMWTLASLLSVHSRDLAEPFYRQTKQMLEHLSIEADNENSSSTTLAQAWVLVIIYEYTRTYHRQAWMSAGRAFRLIQAMRYHEIDKPVADKRGPSSPQYGDFIEVEERRRVFWMSYLLDHVISMRDDWPITLNEHVICTRLPALDVEFQNGSHELGPLLSEAMMETNPKVQSSFNECLVLATLCGRSLLQSQQYQISKAYGDTSMDWTEQRKWLDNIMSKRLQVLSRCYPAPTESNEPLLLFASVLGQASIIYFCKAMNDASAWPENSLSESSPEFIHYQNRALEASASIIRLASNLCDLPLSKVHPLTPIPLFLCAEFLYEGMHNHDFLPQLQDLFRVLGELKNINNPNQSYLDLLPSSCISRTAELFIHTVG